MKRWGGFLFILSIFCTENVFGASLHPCEQIVDENGAKVYGFYPTGCPFPKVAEKTCPQSKDWLRCSCPESYNRTCTGYDECPLKEVMSCNGKYETCGVDRIPQGGQLTPCGKDYLTENIVVNDCGRRFYVCREKSRKCKDGGSVDIKCDFSKEDRVPTGEITETGEPCFRCEKSCFDTCVSRGLSDIPCRGPVKRTESVCGKVCYECYPDKECSDGSKVVYGSCCKNEKKCGEKCVPENECCPGEMKCGEKCIPVTGCCSQSDCGLLEKCEKNQCVGDPEKICKDKGYIQSSKLACAPYEQNDVCPDSDDWKRCLDTCASLIKKTDPLVSINADNDPKDAKVAVVVENIEKMPEAEKIVSVVNYALAGVALCANEIPEINVQEGSLNKNIENVKISGKPEVKIDGEKTWKNVEINVFSPVTLRANSKLVLAGEKAHVKASYLFVEGEVENQAEDFVWEGDISVRKGGKLNVDLPSKGQFSLKNGTLYVEKDASLFADNTQDGTLYFDGLTCHEGAACVFKNGKYSLNSIENFTLLDIDAAEVETSKLVLHPSSVLKLGKNASLFNREEIDLKKGALICALGQSEIRYKTATQYFNKDSSFWSYPDRCECEDCSPMSVFEGEEGGRFNKICPRRKSGCKHNACWSDNMRDWFIRCDKFWNKKDKKEMKKR